MFKMMLTGLFVALTACAAQTDSTTSNSTGSGSASCPSSGQACTVDNDCPANEECDDGACKAHDSADCSEDESGETEPGDDNGVDPPGTETEHHGGSDD